MCLPESLLKDTGGASGVMRGIPGPLSIIIGKQLRIKIMVRIASAI